MKAENASDFLRRVAEQEGDDTLFCPHGCTREFRSRLVFDLHMREVHGEGPGATLPEVPNIQEIQEIQEVEKMADPIMCEKCGAGPFTSTQQRGSHNRHEHPRNAGRAPIFPARSEPVPKAPPKLNGRPRVAPTPEEDWAGAARRRYIEILLGRLEENWDDDLAVRVEAALGFATQS